MVSLRQAYKVAFYCIECGERDTAHIFLPNQANLDDGVEVFSDIEVTCDACGTEHLVRVQSSSSGHVPTLLDAPGSDLELAPEDFDDFLTSYEPPSDPLSIFEASVLELSDFLKQRRDAEDGASSFTRMVFVQLFSAFEAYVADQLIRAVIENPLSRRRLLEREEGLRKQEVSLIQVETKPSLVIDRITLFLGRVSYHDFEKVDRLYRNAFDHTIYPPPITDLQQLLLDASKSRHDCVHRNGRDRAGNLLQHIDHAYVNGVAVAMLEVALQVASIVRPPREDDDLLSIFDDDDLPW